ncbi:MAG: magnesium transporter [Synechococcus sp.]|nr:magnesium transporter [Synechococcus sp.]
MTIFPPFPIRSESAGSHLTERVPQALGSDRAAEVRGRLADGGFDALETLYVLDEAGRLEGLIELSDLLAAPAEGTMRELMRRAPVCVHPHDDQEQVAGLAVEYKLAAVPVADGEGRFLGVVPPTALITILRREHIEDLNLLAGLRHDHLRSLRAMTEAPVHRVRERLPWLLVGLAGSFLATWMVSRYEQTLNRQVMVAFFMPAIVYLADAIGTQSEAIAVRGFSMNHMPLRRSIVGEIQTGFLIGSILGLLSIPFVLIGFGSQRLALAVALSIFAAGGVATSVGILLPWGLERLGRDPAFGSGPVATIIQDLLSLLIYFLIVQLLGV